ncbi:MAG: hypothetical protein EBU27_05690, partial [Opitutae bacterium]|nr:hypothetical protein [Opitutae bacterium]
DPSDPTQAGFWRVPFDDTITNQLSAFTFFKHGGVSAMDLKNGKFGVSHPLETSIVSYESTVTLNNQRWYHLHKQVDTSQGLTQLYVDGNLAINETFDTNLGIEEEIESEWIIGSGTISSTVDEIRVSNTVRSPDWITGSFENQKDNPTFPTVQDSLIGPPSFTSANRFVIPAEQSFSHIARATGNPTAFVGSGLPSGLLLNPADGFMQSTLLEKIGLERCFLFGLSQRLPACLLVWPCGLTQPNCLVRGRKPTLPWLMECKFLPGSTYQEMVDI